MSGPRLASVAFSLLITASPAAANPARVAILDAFATNCFSPFLTASKAEAAILPTGARLDFYDLNPFSNVPASPGTNVTDGTDRRCEVAFDGRYGEDAAKVAAAAAKAEGITTEAPLPATHATAAREGTSLLAARALNPRRIAVVHTGTRPGPNGPETFLSVERLTPEASLRELTQ